MNKITLPLLAVGLAVLAAPAFATHPYEECNVRVNVDAAIQKAGAAKSPVKIHFFFSRNMSDMNPQEPEKIAPPAEGPWIYRAKVYSSLYERKLVGVRVESAKYDADTGKPVWTSDLITPVASDAPEAQKKDAAILCENGAD